MRHVGCTGGSCPKQEHCERFLEDENRNIHFQSPPFNRYEDGVVECNYYEPHKEED